MRIYDTSTGAGGISGMIASNTVNEFQITGLGDVPSSASAAFIQITTVVGDSQTGYLRVGPVGNSSRSILNFQPATTTVIGTTMPLGTTGKLSLEVLGRSAGIHLAIDVIGYFTTASDGYLTVQPARVFDSRSPSQGTLASQERRVVQVAGIAGVPSATQLPSAVAADVHVLHPGPLSGSIEIRPTERASGPANLFYSPNSTRTDFVMMELGLDGTVTVKNRSNDPVDVIVDVVGWYSFPTQNTDLADITARSSGKTTTEVQLGVQNFAATNGFSYVAALSRLAREARVNVAMTADTTTPVSGTEGLPLDEPVPAATEQNVLDSTANDANAPDTGAETDAGQLVPEGSGGGSSTNSVKVPVGCTTTGNFIYSYASTAGARHGHNAIYVGNRGCEVVHDRFRATVVRVPPDVESEFPDRPNPQA
ncbi:MAG: hypothetical protein WKF57_12850 [Nakamurella sp.]